MNNRLKQLLIWLTIFLSSCAWSGGLKDQGNGAVFEPEEIEQLVAPIALYSDSLVSQILIAATYPLEVVQADRWVKANKSLQGEALTAALESQSWDPSVKSLVNFPQVLGMMGEKLDWTQRLGEAFLAQQKDVLDAVQRLRAKAQGNLKTTKEQTVIVEQPEAQTKPVHDRLCWLIRRAPNSIRLERVKKGVTSHFSRGLSTDECLDFPQKAIQKNGAISSRQGLF